MMDFREDSYRDKLADRYGFDLAQKRHWGDMVLAIAFGLFVLLWLTGCAQMAQPVQGVCAFQPIGENEEGVQFFRYHCKPRE